MVLGADNSDRITGVTYNGTAMTLLAKVQGSGARWLYEYRLIAPASGTHNIVVSASSNAPISLIATSYTGCHQSSQPTATTGSTTTTFLELPTAYTRTTYGQWGTASIMQNTSYGIDEWLGGYMRRHPTTRSIAMVDSGGPLLTDDAWQVGARGAVSAVYAYILSGLNPLDA